ncbi:MAG: ABC transporter permease [Clostridiales Family XIII bacterium]|jgi:peptide/nickel transport system permease protein|nr:ABC transporter permease [Clostridiales Family XIII bacterium]
MKKFFLELSLGSKISLFILVVIALWLIFPALFGANHIPQDIITGVQPPGTAGHLLGTDSLGRDVLKLTIAGTRSALIGPLVIATGSIILGLLLGSLAGWYGGKVDWIISRYADITLSMPTLLLAIVAAGIIGGGYWVSVLVMTILYSPFDIRLVRSAVIGEKHKPYIEAGLVLKLKTIRILARHIFPNIAIVVMVNFFLNIAYGLMSMSSLSFLGLGVSPGSADWGRQLADSRGILWGNPAAALSAGIAIIITAVAINTIGNNFVQKKSL